MRCQFGILLGILALKTESESKSKAMAVVPLIRVPSNTDIEPPSKETSQTLVRALQDSGFLLVQSPLLTPQFQSEALCAASCFLDSGRPSLPSQTARKEDGNDDDQNNNDDNNSQHEQDDSAMNIVISHPTDPKLYAMLKYDDINLHVLHQRNKEILKKYMDILRKIKMDILRHIALGLDLDNNINNNNGNNDREGCNCNFLSNLHSHHNDTLRLISYYPTNSSKTKNRCKEHSDYGTLTLLSTDGVSGLELYDSNQKCWLPVPHVEGTLVVNIGSLLSGWTGGKLKATLHRVAGPASEGSGVSREDLLMAVRCRRTSIAFFVDPNEDVSNLLRVEGRNGIDVGNSVGNSVGGQGGGLQEALGGMSIKEYIQWRSGGIGVDRIGVSFTRNEEEEMEG